MADITLHLSESGTSIDTRVKEAHQSSDATSSPSQTMSRSHSAKRNETNPQPANNLMNSHVAPAPDSPAPPPRLSKEAAEMRLKNSPSKAPSPIPNNPTARETRSYQPSTSSPLANFSQGLTKVAKAAARTPTSNLFLFKTLTTLRPACEESPYSSYLFETSEFYTTCQVSYITLLNLALLLINLQRFQTSYR
ncbi:hypothetical protein DSO57_1000531 [Entomophthora muscae]|uniref:Uncharacterized protein n=1 Tax=Entomophthora muscae TaxID=34485 RepID=A0ACC2RP62_9FUNG|nr:hypothetical protein DSO57_1000531 [Entomophthora muscae]